MGLDLSKSTFGKREERLGSIVGYTGTLKDLAQQSRCGTLRDRGRCFQQSSSCDHGCVLGYITHIRNVAIVNHAPAGCTGSASSTLTNQQQLAAKRDLGYDTVITGTDLDENDTIFGASGGLLNTILETYERYHPSAIFVTASCVSGIIGEDIDAVADEAQESIPVPVVPIHCEGFKSKVWATGFDAADHAVLSRIVKKPEKKGNFVTFKNFNESAREDITEMFAEIGVDTFFVYSNTTIEELSHMSEGLATVSICGTLGSYLGNGLEQAYGIPYIKTINPVGVTGFETWFREVGSAIGKSDEVERYIRKQREIWIPKIREVSEKLKGLHVVLGMGSSFAFQIARVVMELGMTVDYVASWHYDSIYDDGNPPPHVQYLDQTVQDFPVGVIDQQNFEILNILNRLKPDLYLARHGGTTVWAIKSGIPSIFMADEYMAFGYKRTYSFANLILDKITNRSFEKNLSSRITLPYTKWWYEQNNASLYKELPEALEATDVENA